MTELTVSFIREPACFNGARARAPWMTIFGFLNCFQRILLQWGQGASALDDNVTAGRLIRDGMLQWGQGASALDDVTPRIPEAPHQWLQWGQGASALDDVT